MSAHALTRFPGSATQRVAWQLLDAYTACADASFESMQAQLSAGLAGLGAPGASFAFVLHDRSRHRVVAARDRSGAQTLLWGCARARAPPTSAPWPRVTRQQLLSHRPRRAPRFISQDDAGRLAGVLLHHGLRDQPDDQPAGACAARGRAAQQLPRCSPRYPPAYRFFLTPAPQAFPAGCLFISEVDSQPYNVFVRGAIPGALTSFARAAGRGAIPRAGSSSGGLCRVASGTDLALITSRMGRVPSFNDLAPGAMMRGAAR